MKNDPSKKKTERNILNIYNSFTENYKSIEIFYSKLSPIAATEDKTIIQAKETFVNKCIDEVIGKDFFEQSSIDGSKRKPVTREMLEKLLKKAIKAPNIPAKNYEILARSAFIMLNNYFEYLFSDLLTFHFNKNKQSLNNKKINITIEELLKYPSIEEASEDIIRKEVDALILQLNFDELKSYFEDKLNIKLEKELVDWSKIDEIRERRHLIIHNNSIINNKYIIKTNNPYKLDINSTVDIDSEYFKNSLDEIKIAGTLIILNCWGNWDKEHTTHAIIKILDFTFENLLSLEYELVRKICEYTEKNIKPRNDEDDNFLHKIAFNHCIALKKLDRESELTKKVNSIKVGALSPIFKIASYILKGDLEKAVKLLPSAKLTDDITIEKYDQWPVFEDIRNNPVLNKNAREFLLK